MSKHHTLDYIEFGTTNLTASKEFLATVFGWNFNDYGPAYSAIASPDGTGEVGGIDAAAVPTDGGALVQVYSDDLDATQAAVTAAGGIITTDVFTFPGGRRFAFREPGGNVLGVWSAS